MASRLPPTPPHLPPTPPRAWTPGHFGRELRNPSPHPTATSETVLTIIKYIPTVGRMDLHGSNARLLPGRQFNPCAAGSATWLCQVSRGMPMQADRTGRRAQRRAISLSRLVRIEQCLVPALFEAPHPFPVQAARSRQRAGSNHVTVPLRPTGVDGMRIPRLHPLSPRPTPDTLTPEACQCSRQILTAVTARASRHVPRTALRRG